MPEKRQIFKQCARWILTLLCCIAVGLGLMVAVAYIPQKAIKDQLRSSAEFEQTEGTNRFATYLQKVHYTEAAMAILACTMDETRPLASALESTMYAQTEFMESPVADFKAMLTKGNEGMKECHYNRYWHGYLVALRPLLYFFDLPSIRWYSFALFSILAGVLFTLIYRDFGMKFGILFIIMLLHAKWLSGLPFSLDQNIVYFIMMISSIIIMESKALFKSTYNLPVFFVIIGACTSFMDFLTAPVLTLGFPLIITFLKRGNTEVRQQLFIIATCSIAWCFGYVGMWAAKWVLCAPFSSDAPIFDIVKGSLKQRSIGEYTFDVCRFCRFIFYPLPDLGIHWWTSVVSALIFTLGLHLSYLYIRYRKQFINNICYLILAIFPVLWFMGTSQHTVIHLMFTYRIVELAFVGYGIFAIKVHQKKAA